MLVLNSLRPQHPRTAIWRLRAPWRRTVGWAVASQEVAIGNARAATTELSRQALVRDEVEVFLAERRADRAAHPAAAASRRS